MNISHETIREYCQKYIPSERTNIHKIRKAMKLVGKLHYGIYLTKSNKFTFQDKRYLTIENVLNVKSKYIKSITSQNSYQAKINEQMINSIDKEHFISELKNKYIQGSSNKIILTFKDKRAIIWNKYGMPNKQISEKLNLKKGRIRQIIYENGINNSLLLTSIYKSINKKEIGIKKRKDTGKYIFNFGRDYKQKSHDTLKNVLVEKYSYFNNITKNMKWLNKEVRRISNSLDEILNKYEDIV